MTLAQENRIQQRNLQLIIGVLLTVVLLISIGYFNRQKQWHAAQELMRFEQRFWRAQLNPHFFFNALSSIQQVLTEGKAPEIASSLLSKLASFMRQTMEANVHDFILLQEELEQIKAYLEIQQFRFNQQFDFVIQVGENIDIDNIQIPPMMIQPFVENAIEHGKLHQIQDGTLWITIQLSDDHKLTINIEDNGVGLSSTSQDELFQPIHGNGMVRERLHLFTKQHRKKFGLQVVPRPSKGTLVQLDIPAEMAF